MASGGAIVRISKLLVVSYIVDWIFVMYVSPSRGSFVAGVLTHRTVSSP